MARLINSAIPGDAGLLGAKSLALPSVSKIERRDGARVSGDTATRGRAYIPAREPEPVWPTVDEVADLIAVLAILIGGCWLVGKATLL